MMHGDAADEVRDDDNVRVMLLQDQARNLKHNKRLTSTRQDKIEEAGAFRAPLPESTSKFKRGFQLSPLLISDPTRLLSTSYAVFCCYN